MQQINELINFFKNISHEQLIDYAIAIIVAALFFICSSALSFLIIKIFKFKEKDRTKVKHNPFYSPLRALFITIGIFIGILIINPPEQAMNICTKIFQITLICIGAKALINLVDPQKGLVKKLRNDDMPDGNKTVASFTSKILKYIIYIGAGLLILTVFNINPSSLIAGLGIGSAVVALAAQDFVKNLISGFSIMSDKPFLVGDWIEVGTNQGSVIEITFRVTKIKTSDNSIVTIQNSVFTTNNVINWSRIEQRRYSFNVKLPLETNADQIEKVINKIKFVLNNNEDIVKDSVQVHFDTIGLDSVNIIIFMYTNIIAYNDYLEFREKVNSEVLRVLESENMKMAYPGQNVYVHQVEDKLSEDKVEK